MPGGSVGGTHGGNYSNSAGYGTLPPNEVFMHKVLILGAGKIGALISGLLAESGDYDVTLGDVDAIRRRSRGESSRFAHTCGPWPLTRRRQGARKPFRGPQAARRHLQPALLLQSGRGQGGAQGQCALLRSHRRRRGHAGRAADRAWCIEGVRAPMWTRAGLHQHRGQRTRQAFRRAAFHQAARRRPAPAP